MKVLGILMALASLCLVRGPMQSLNAGQQTDAQTAAAQAPESDSEASLSWGRHEPIKECRSCHTDTLPDDPGNSLKAPVPQLCKTCHTAFSDLAGRVHGPVATGQCLICHEPHQAATHSLLRKLPPDLCRQCHEAANLAQVKNHRNPAFADCRVCHEAHTGTGRMLLKPEFIKAQEILALLSDQTPVKTRFVGQRESLQGIKAVTLVPTIDRAKRFEPYGLTQRMLYTHVEQLLKDLGISILTQETRTPQTASLSVHLSLAEVPSPLSGQITALSGSLNLKLEQTVTLPPLPDGDTSRTCTATTWDTGGIVVWGTRQCKDGLKNALEVFVTQFGEAVEEASAASAHP